MAFDPAVLIFGNNECARHLSQLLAAQGIHAIQSEASRLAACSGQAGAFQVTLALNGHRATHKVSSIVLAEQIMQLPNWREYGHEHFKNLITVSDLEAALRGTKPAPIVPVKAKVVFLNGWRNQSHPVMAARMLTLCLHLQKGGQAQTIFMTSQLKVAEDGMEACYQEAKSVGTLFLKFTEQFPVLAVLGDGRIQIDYWDETTRMDFRMTADRVVMDERLAPHPGLTRMAQILRLDCDAMGFAQSDNVRRLPNHTNRRGIFAMGGARAVLAGQAQLADAEQTTLEVAQFLSDTDQEPGPRAQIDQGRCARCLTCYRLCPYAAIDIEPRMTISPAACQGCGLCAAGCPNRAIDIQAPEPAKALQRLAGQGAAVDMSGPFTPQLTVFCCSRSAIQARDAAMTMGNDLWAGILFVQGVCGGTFAVHHLLNAFEAGTDGVMVLTCHEGNCHSESGTVHAKKRVAEAIRQLAPTGISAQRIEFHTLAANMGAEFAQVVTGFAEKIKALGPGMG